MSNKLDKGEKLTCKRSFSQNNEELFTAGHQYTCPEDNCITDNNGSSQYGWNRDMLKQHFVRSSARRK